MLYVSIDKLKEKVYGDIIQSEEENGVSKRFFSERLSMNFRSNWEIKVAEILTDLEIAFEYEPRRFYFRREKESYLPDFYIPEADVWIEVKGWYDNRSRRRQFLFNKYNKDQVLFMVKEEEYKRILKEPELLRTLISIAKLEKERIDRSNAAKQ